MKQRILFIGGGNMGEALLKGLRSSPETKALPIIVSDPDTKRLEFLKSTYNVEVAKKNRAAAEDSDTIVLAVKPEVMQGVLSEIFDKAADKLIVSIAAGITLSSIRSQLPETGRVVRVMPNTPALSGEGVSALSFSENVAKREQDFVQSIFEAVGKTVVVQEKLMDGVTGLSGSGPAFIFLVIEALADAGVKMGISRETALLLSAQTVKGAAEMALATGKHPAVLKDMVTSPGGTTISGLHALEKGSVRGSFINAVEVAAKKAQELGER
ncbi:MAG: pyrroline-5-carboxylate reductase [Nitrospinota bacterium]